MRKVLGLLGLVIVGLVGFIATRPADFRIERSATIAAPPEVVHAQINDFHKWADWSPWEKLDPAMKKTLEGPDAGVGAIYSWVGNKDVGEGRMTITESQPNERVGIKLEFLKPMAQTNQTTFTLTPEGDGTKVAWIMEGKNDFMGKAFGLFMNIDQMVGKDFEKGLANLNQASQKAAAEAAAAAASTPQATRTSMPPVGTH